MKTKLTILAAALLFAGFTASAQAADQRIIYNSKGQVLAVVRDSSAVPTPRYSSGPVHYVASPSGKGGAVTVASDRPETSIALFKSKKTDACCIKR